MRQGEAAEHLGAELENIVLSDRKITLPPWPDGKGWEFAAPEYDDTEHSQGTGGSNNWPVEAWGCRYSIDFRGRGWHREKEAREFFAKARQMFGGAELDSTIYTYMQAHAVLEVAHVAKIEGHTEVYSEAMAWLTYLAARCELFRSERTGRILTCGDRSAALLGPGERSWQDRYADIGMQRRAWPKERILTARANIVRDAFDGLREGRWTPIEILRNSGFRTLVPVRVAEWPGGKAVWRNGKRWHGSTQPVAVAMERAGREEFAPYNRGYTGNPKNKLHRQPGVPTVTESATAIVYESPVYQNETFILPPRSVRTLDLEVGGPAGVRDLLHEPAPEPVPNPGPIAPTPGTKPDRPSWIERMSL